MGGIVKLVVHPYFLYLADHRIKIYERFVLSIVVFRSRVKHAPNKFDCSAHLFSVVFFCGVAKTKCIHSFFYILGVLQIAITFRKRGFKYFSPPGIKRLSTITVRVFFGVINNNVFIL